MTQVYLRKTPQGFVPDTDRDWDAAKRFKLGAVVKAEITNPRNVRFFRKWWALVQVGYEMWEETGVSAEYKGEKVLPNFDRFRRDVTILAGYGHPVVNLRGEVRVEADSISFGKMDEDTFENLYSATLTAIVHKVLRGRISEDRMREMADAVMEFA